MKISIPNDYVEVTELKDVQTMLIPLLKQFHEICEEHHLFYTILAGSMLGAVRHQGIIPWDDDIDVSMPRPDYDKFISIVRNLDNSKFKVYAYPDKDYPYNYAKFCLTDSMTVSDVRRKYSCQALFLDIFPVDGFPVDNQEEYFKQLDRCMYGLARCRCLVNVSKNPLKRIFYPIRLAEALLYRTRGLKYYMDKIERLFRRIDFDTAEYVFVNGTGWKANCKLSKQDYLDRALFDFNGLKVWGTRNYHEHLTNVYGDYMQYPPEEKRVSGHTHRLYVKRALYEEALKTPIVPSKF